MREIRSHKLTGLNDAIEITVRDEPGQGGACHHYRMTYPGPIGSINPGGYPSYAEVYFQNGPILEAGVNGISGEAMIAIVIDRLQSFQKGAYACRENAIALTKLEESMHWLQHRTRERLSRGVEGTNQK